MKTKIFFLALLFLTTGLESIAQISRANERTWHALRGGIFFGACQSFYTGDVPMLPVNGNEYFSDGSGTNFIFGAYAEKAFSRLISLGLRLSFDPMSAKIDGHFKEPYRIADPQGILYTVKRDQSADYVLRYFSLGAYAKLYPNSGPGLFFGGGLTFSTLIKNTYLTTAVVTDPEWARGSESPSQSGDIQDVNPVRFAIDMAVGYDFFIRYAFISPELHFDVGLNNVADASYARTWSVNNLRFVLAASFPLPY